MDIGLKMDKPLVSVIIPVYNGEKYIKQCLENVISQSEKGIEVIVIDDGSTDRTVEIARTYPVKIIEHDVNRGLAASRNTGMDAAQGEYIHFLDVDDGVNEDYYKNLLAAINETGADMACGGMLHEQHPHRTQRFKKQQVFTTVHSKLKITYVGKWGYVWRYLFRKQFLVKHHIRFEEGRLVEDLLFSFLAVFYARKLVVVPGTEYHYYHRENSIMSNRDKNHLRKRNEDWVYATSVRKEFARKHNIKIPGVDTGRIAYIARKVFVSIKN